MATRITNAIRTVLADAVVDAIDAGAAAGTIQVRTGAQPATADTAASGTLLATFTLSDPAFGAAVNGVATLDVTPIPSATAVATGTAGWFRVLDSNAVTVFDGSVTVTGGGGQLELNTVSISSGGTVEITAGTVTMPAG